jgi:[glutamine synthetase] adenylyltransferase / [glutamine synthetase]-adenylyl-L-tyrosine phosphorylase
MTAASDLDLILLYDFDPNAIASDGRQPLPPQVYFTRLTQRLVSAVSAPTGEGRLYAVDFRLRPSGKSGPLATHIDAFTAYQAKDAWTWEHMALTRARPIAGDGWLVARVRRDIAAIVTAERDGDKVWRDVAEMRTVVEDAKGGTGPWDVKQAAGGLVDIEFIAQGLQLIHASRHPAILSTETDAALVAAAADGVLASAEADVLLPAFGLLSALLQILRLCVDGSFAPSDAPAALRDRLAQVGDMPDFASLEAHVAATEAAVRASFVRLVGSVGTVAAGSAE